MTDVDARPSVHIVFDSHDHTVVDGLDLVREGMAPPSNEPARKPPK